MTGRAPLPDALPGRFRLAYEPHSAVAGTPWRIEMETGECLYSSAIVLLGCRARTVLGQRNGRASGYLEIDGFLDFDPAETVFRGVGCPRSGRRDVTHGKD